MIAKCMIYLATNDISILIFIFILTLRRTKAALVT